MKTEKEHNREGIALLFVMIIMVIAAALAVGSMAKGGGLAITAERTRQDIQNQWASEAGLERVAAEFYTSDSSDGGTETFTDSSGRIISLDIDVSFAGTNTLGYKTHTVTSSASIDGVLKSKISQLFTIETENNTDFNPDYYFGNIPGAETNAAYPYALWLENGGSFEVANSSWEAMYVFGDVYYAKVPDIDGLMIWVTGSINGSEEPTEAPEVTDEDIQGWLDLTPSTEAITAIQSIMADLSTSIDNGSTIVKYIDDNHNLTIPAGETWVLKNSSTDENVDVSALNINGTGTLIIEGDLNIENNSTLTISSDATLLIGGNVVGQNMSELLALGDNSLVYVRENITLNNKGTIEGSLLVGGYFDAFNCSAASAFIFVNDYMISKNNAGITGVIIANQLIAENNATFIVDNTVISDRMKDLMAKYLSGTTTTSTKVANVIRSNWTKEI